MGSLPSLCTPDAFDTDALQIVRSIVYKIDELSSDGSLYCPDIVCTRETWLNKDVLDTEVCSMLG